MTLQNVTFQNSLEFIPDHVFTMEIHPPKILSRVILSLLALETGSKPIEPFFLTERGEELNAGKILYVVTDPFQIEINSKKNLSSLYSRLESLLRADPEQMTEWSRIALKFTDLVNNLLQQLPFQLNNQNEITLAQYCKAIELTIAEERVMDPIQHVYALLDFAAEFFPEKLIVLCNTGLYLEDSQRIELLKYICYSKLQVLFVDNRLPDTLYENEIRWTIHNDFSDEIVHM